MQTTLDLISGYAGVPKAEIDFLCAGINHMGWFLELLHGDRDLYPALHERFEKPVKRLTNGSALDATVPGSAGWRLCREPPFSRR